MRVIAERKNALLFLYIFCLIVGIISFLLGLFFNYKGNGLEMIMPGIVLIGISLYFVIRIATTPKEIIVYDKDNKTIIIMKKIVLPINNIFDVSYKRASPKAHQYKWGTIIINKSIKCKYVKNCEEVSKQLKNKTESILIIKPKTKDFIT